VAGAAGVVVVVVLCRMVNEASALTFHGGFALLALGTAATVAAVTQVPSQPMAWVLSRRPLAYLGRISYGMYLWYLPVLTVMTARTAHLSGVALLVARSVVIVLVAALSFHLVETPVRRGTLTGMRSWIAVPMSAAVVSLVPLLVPTATGASAPSVSMPAAVAAASIGHGRASGPPVRMLLVGDSIDGSLGVGLSQMAARLNVEIINRGSPGCSLAEGDAVRVLWYTDPPGAPCNAADPNALLQSYAALVKRFDPDVVLYLARSDTLDTELHGTWQHLGDPGFDRWAASRFRAAVSVLSSEGARVVFLTSPFYDSGEQGDGQPWPENAPARVVTDNRLLTQAARSAPARASVVDLGAFLSPGGHFATDVDGVRARCSDGVHFTVAGGELVASRLMPELRSFGTGHASTQAALARAPLAPEAQPWWYAELPCAT
jgi:hypothetical protein